MTSPTPEAIEAAARAIHDRECEDGPMCTATPTSMTRYADLARCAVDAVWSLAYDAGVAAGRGQAAADIRDRLFAEARELDNERGRVQATALRRAAGIAVLVAEAGGEPS